jgi:hypothetical protein
MAEDFDNHRRIFDGGDDLQCAATIRAVFDVNVEIANYRITLSARASTFGGTVRWICFVVLKSITDQTSLTARFKIDAS